MARLARRVVTVTASAVAAAALVACLAALAFFGLGPHTGLYRTETVLSGSMVPRFAPGDVVVVTPEPLTAVRVGQIITYHAPVADHEIVSHRVIRIIHGGANPVIQTKGDANPVPDPWTARLQGTTAWRVRFVVPGAGFVIEWLRQTPVRLALVGAVPLLLCVIWLREIWRDDEDELEPVGAQP